MLTFPINCHCVPSHCSAVNLLSFETKISEPPFKSWQLCSFWPVFPLALEYRPGRSRVGSGSQLYQ